MGFETGEDMGNKPYEINFFTLPMSHSFKSHRDKVQIARKPPFISVLIGEVYFSEPLK